MSRRRYSGKEQPCRQAEALLRDWNAGLLTRDQMLDRLVRLWWMGLRR